MSKAFWSTDFTPRGLSNLMHLSEREQDLIQDGLAALLAALPAQHALRPEVVDLIESLKEKS